MTSQMSTIDAIHLWTSETKSAQLKDGWQSLLLSLVQVVRADTKAFVHAFEATLHRIGKLQRLSRRLFDGEAARRLAAPDE